MSLCSTWNAWHDRRHVVARFEALIHAAISSGPGELRDVVALQEITRETFDLLLAHRRVRKHYVVSDCKLHLERVIDLARLLSKRLTAL